MNLITSYKNLVIANQSWADALAKSFNLKDADALTQAEKDGKKFYLPESIVEKLAQAHAEAYGIKHKTTIYYQQSSTGSWQFYSDEECNREDRHDTATKQWQRTAGKYHKTNAKPKTKKQVDEVAQAIKSLRNKFSKAELKRIANGIV